MSKTLDYLLKADILPSETKEFRIRRLSKGGDEAVFTLKSLGYNRVAELKKMENEVDIHLVLAGVVDPDLKDQRLLDKYGSATPADLLKKLLSPGEIEDLSREVERLSGYRIRTIEEVKKK